MQDIRAFTFRQVLEEDGELLGRLIAQLYTATLPPPPVLVLPTALPDQELRAELLSEVAGRKVRLSSRSRGEGRRLLGLAAQNAQVRFAVAHSQQERSEQALFGLERALGLPSLPRRIECYDNSNIQGADPVGALVTFVDGRAHKAGYRIFKIKGVDGADDYATMTEVLSRRVKRATEGSVGWELPDLIVIDGGRGQLAQVEAVCRDLDVSVPLCSVAKPQEGEATDKIYIPGRKNPIKLKARDPALQLLQQLRDEAHRFGVHHHRKQRTGRTLTSGLDRIPGVGKQLRGRLLRHFGSLKRVRAAEVEELRAVRGVGEGLARVIREELRRG